MKKIKLIAFAICLLILQYASAQIKVGQKLPNIALKNFKDKQGKDITMDSYKGRFLIIDFFATWCGTCVGSLPRLNDIKAVYGDKVEVLVVTSETKQVYDKAAKTMPNVKNNKLPVVFEDSLLSSLFPHQMIPHEIWVDDQGFVRAITHSKFVTENNVKKFLDKEKIDLPVKVDLGEYDKKIDLAGNIAKTGDNIKMFVSAVSDNIPGFNSFSGQKMDSTALTRYFINSTLLGFYSILIDPKYWGGRVILEVTDKNRFLPFESDSEDWDTKNTFCYEIKVPKGCDEERINRIMKNNIDNYFSLTTGVEEREVNCWGIVVKNIDTLLKQSIATKKGIDKGFLTAVYEAISLKQLSEELNEAKWLQHDAPIYLDESDYKGTINFEIPASLLTSRNQHVDVKVMKKYLESKGLNLISAKKKMEVFVIRDSEDISSAK